MSALDAAEHAELGHLPGDAGAGALVHLVEYVLVGCVEFFFDGAQALASDNDALILQLTGPQGSRREKGGPLQNSQTQCKSQGT